MAKQTLLLGAPIDGNDLGRCAALEALAAGPFTRWTVQQGVATPFHVLILFRQIQQINRILSWVNGWRRRNPAGCAALTRLHVFADEAGNFDFRRAPNVSNHYVICTVATTDCATPAAALTGLRRQLAWEQAPLRDYFHCTTDAQAVRDRVFDAILECDFGIQATIMEKAKANPSIRKTEADFYRHGWLYHLRHGLRDEIRSTGELHITAASIGTKKGQAVFTDAVRDVVRETVDGKVVRTSFWQCATDPCLQLADYCTWAIQRKWETGDSRAYDRLRSRITYEYELFARGRLLYY